MDQMTKSVRMRGMNLLHFVLMVAVMTIAWLTMNSPSIAPQTPQITTTAVLLCYLVLSVFLYQTYNAYKIGMYRAGETFYSMTLANLIGNALTYLFACLIQSQLLDRAYIQLSEYRCGGLVPGRRHMAAMHGLVSAERRMGAGGSLLQFRRRMGARLTEVIV